MSLLEDISYRRLPYLKRIWEVERGVDLTSKQPLKSNARLRDTPLQPPLLLDLHRPPDIFDNWFLWLKAVNVDLHPNPVSSFIELQYGGGIRILHLSTQGIALWGCAQVTHRAVLEGDLAPHLRTYPPVSDDAANSSQCQCQDTYYSLPVTHVEALLTCRNPCKCSTVAPFQIVHHRQTEVYTISGCVIWHLPGARRVVIRNGAVLVERLECELTDGIDPKLKEVHMTMDFVNQRTRESGWSESTHAFKARSFVQILRMYLSRHKNSACSLLERRIAGTIDVVPTFKHDTTIRDVHRYHCVSLEDSLPSCCRWICEEGSHVGSPSAGLYRYYPSHSCSRSFRIHTNCESDQDLSSFIVGDAPSLGIFTLLLVIGASFKGLELDGRILTQSVNMNHIDFTNPFEMSTSNWNEKIDLERTHRSLDLLKARFSSLSDTCKDFHNPGEGTGWFAITQLFASETRFRRCPCRCYQRSEGTWLMSCTDQSTVIKQAIHDYFDFLLRFHDAKQLYWCRDPSTRCTDFQCTLETEHKVLAGFFNGQRSVPRWIMGSECLCGLLSEDHPQSIPVTSLESQMAALVDMSGFRVQNVIDSCLSRLMTLSSKTSFHQQTILTNVVTSELQLRALGMPFYPLQTIAALFGANRIFSINQAKLMWVCLPWWYVLASSLMSSGVAYYFIRNTLNSNIFTLG
eukprot:GHVH01003927.1.p1 GENE.GHVH01003927.1~~GHVH01003927.1.p1  ORF type:complete len:686 (+),score=87.53 GHVH01003927.1:146-2203(+)